MEMKICKICKKEFPIESFYLNRGYRLHTCKFCITKREVARTLRKRKIRFSRDWFSRKFYRLRRHAKDRNKKFELTFEEFCRIRTYKNERCLYCETIHGPFSIERVDNTKGYSTSNCAVACWRCNKMKSKDYTTKEMHILGAALRKIDRMRHR